MIRLTNRLAAAASLVRGGGVVADIGTDHAYLPVYLCQKGVAKRAVASDVGAGPLRNAEKTVKKYGFENRIELRLSDGLQAYVPGEVDEIVICGMGGILISEILSASPWIRNKGFRLILQPMSHPQYVRRYLCENGFGIEKELCVSEGRRVYLCLSAVYDGVSRQVDPGYLYFGDLPPKTEDARTYKEGIYRHLKTRVDSVCLAGQTDDETEEMKAAVLWYERMLVK